MLLLLPFCFPLLSLPPTPSLFPFSSRVSERMGRVPPCVSCGFAERSKARLHKLVDIYRGPGNTLATQPFQHYAETPHQHKHINTYTSRHTRQHIHINTHTATHAHQHTHINTYIIYISYTSNTDTPTRQHM